MNTLKKLLGLCVHEYKMVNVIPVFRSRQYKDWKMHDHIEYIQECQKCHKIRKYRV